MARAHINLSYGHFSTESKINSIHQSFQQQQQQKQWQHRHRIELIYLFFSPLKPDLSLFICTVKLKLKLNFKSSECSFRMQQTRIFADVMCAHNMFNQGRRRRKREDVSNAILKSVKMSCAHPHYTHRILSFSLAFSS